MWPLIIPPIVLVLSLGFLVWFLSKKSADPELQERLRAFDNESKPRRFLLFFSHEWGLRMLERMMQRLKLVSLKFHNRFQEFSNFLKRKREEVSESSAPSEGDEPQVPLLMTEDKEHFWDRWHRRHRAPAAESLTPTAEHMVPTASEAVRVTNLSSKEEKSSSRFSGLKRKMSVFTQSESSTPEYFARHKRDLPISPRKFLSEEELIDRIAKNPKDATSYEELGDYYLSNENLEDAKACYRQVIKLSPLNREVKDKVRKLERLLVQREKHKG